MRNQTRIGISSLIFNLDKALKICEDNKSINHIEIGIDNIFDCDILKKYKEKIKNLNLSVGIHLPMELNPCEGIDFIKQKWIEYIILLNKNLNFLDISYYNMHLGYVITNRLKKNKEKYLNNIVNFFEEISLKEKNLPITIENTYTKGGDISNVGSCVEDFTYILDCNDNISFCYDSGHDLICPSNYSLLRNKIKFPPITGGGNLLILFFSIIILIIGLLPEKYLKHEKSKLCRRHHQLDCQNSEEEN